MGRPSVAAERREEILDAVESTIAEHGLQRATLQRIADGITRSAIGHFIGNRDDVIDAAAARGVGRITAQFDAALRSTPLEERLDAFIALVFDRDQGERETVLDLNDELVALAHV